MNNKEQPVGGNFWKGLAFWILIIVGIIWLFNSFPGQRTPYKTITYTEFVNNASAGRVDSITIKGKDVVGKFRDGSFFTTKLPFEDPELINTLARSNVQIKVEDAQKRNWLLDIIISWVPMILFILVWVYFMRQMSSSGSKAFSFGKARVRLPPQNNKVTFNDVAGCDEAKEELKEIIDFLKDPKKFQRLGGKIPKGVLLIGPPGTGKTLLAKAVAGEAEVPFFSISGSDFVEMFVGVGASRVRDLFEQGKKNAPCIIFIDEIDAVGRYRGAGIGGGHDEREQTLNALLVEMDGFDSNEGVIIMAATNRPDVLDPALLRPGRFDRQIVVDRPDVKGREAILRVHTQKIKLAKDVDLKILAQSTPGMSGADLANMVNEAALLAARRNKESVEMEDFEDAKDKIMMGIERRSLVISPEEKKITAYHESGHALVAKLLPGTDPVHKVTIVPRGRALGVTHYLPIDERHTYSKTYIENVLCSMLGGRIAEEIIFNEITTGAGNDLERVTEIARKMVCEWGMSNKLGPLTFGKREEQIFLGKELAQRKDFSEKTAEEIDDEVKSIVLNAYSKTKKLLLENKDLLIAIAEKLLKKEVLSGQDIDKIIKNTLRKRKRVKSGTKKS